LIEPVIRVYPQFGLTELLEVGNTVGLIASLSNTQANFALARAQAYQGVTTMRELTNTEMDAVGGGFLNQTFGHFSPITTVAFNHQNNSSATLQQGFINVNVNPQTNVGTALAF
jgi:hypothetical protein